MAIITETDALAVLPLATMKLELRIDASITDHDALITSQIVAAVSFAAQSTGVALRDLPRSAVVSAVRTMYDGGPVVEQTAAHNSWMEPFRSYKAG